MRSIGGLRGVAGALVDETRDLVFTSNRGADTIGVFTPDREQERMTIEVGARPNGLAFAPDLGILLCAHVGDPKAPGPRTVALVDVSRRARIDDIVVPGRTRWTVYDERRGVFFVNVADPAVIAVVDPRSRTVVEQLAVPDRGPHGLDIDGARRTLACACDGGTLARLDCDTGALRGSRDASSLVISCR